MVGLAILELEALVEAEVVLARDLSMVDVQRHRLQIIRRRDAPRLVVLRDGGLLGYRVPGRHGAPLADHHARRLAPVDARSAMPLGLENGHDTEVGVEVALRDHEVELGMGLGLGRHLSLRGRRRPMNEMSRTFLSTAIDWVPFTGSSPKTWWRSTN